jgi:hypothetical protein
LSAPVGLPIQRKSAVERGCGVRGAADGVGLPPTPSIIVVGSERSSSGLA